MNIGGSSPREEEVRKVVREGSREELRRRTSQVTK
jgi:hypothetical protein